MKLSLSILPIIFCVFISVNVHGRCRKRRVTYMQQSLPMFPPPQPSAFNYQSLDDDLSGRDAFTEIKNTGISSANPANPQHPNLSCLLFADDGCNVSCGLMCDINGCQSDGFCSQKFYCLCNEVYIVQNRPVTADQFRKLNFDDLWNYKFKNSNNSNVKNRIFQNDDLYSFIMPMLQNPHKSGRDIQEALISKYPKLSSAKNLQPREHGNKAKLFGNGNEGEENLKKYIQTMMSTIQNSVYDRLSHTRYMRRIINLIKNINDKNDLSYILRQIRQIGNDRLFERVRRYLMKRGYYFDEDLRPISKKAGFCVKKKAKCKCRKKCKRKRFSYNYGAASVVDEADSDWIEDEDEDDVIETTLINQLINSNNAEGNYPSTVVVDEQSMPDIDYTTPANDKTPSVIQDATIMQQPQHETIIEIIPEEVAKFEDNSLVPPNDTQYVITSNGPDYSVMPQQSTMFVQQSNYPEYGTFFNGVNNNFIHNRPNPNLPSKQFISYETQQIPGSFMAPQTIHFKEVIQPNNGVPQNLNIHSQSLPSSVYFDKPTPPTPALSLNQATPPGIGTIYQKPDQQITTSSQNLENYSKPTIIPQTLEIPTQPTPTPGILDSQNLTQLPQTTTVQLPAIETPSSSPITPQNIEKLPQLADNSLKTQIPQDLTPAIAPLPQKLVENTPQPISIPPALPKPQPIVSPPQNLLQQFATEKPTPKIAESSRYLDKSPIVENLKTFSIPDATPSIESLFVKHSQTPDKSGTINNPESYAEYLLGNGSSTSLPSTEPENLSKSYTESQSTPPLSEFESKSKIFTETPPSNSPLQQSPPQLEIPTSYSYYSNSNNIDSLPILPPSSTTFSDHQTYSPAILSPPTIQKPKDKIYYQVLMDENGNIIKSANYKYPGQPQYIQETPQMPPVPFSQYTSTTNDVNGPLFDKFDKHTILNAAKSKPGDSMVIDYDMETAENIPVLDIPPDIDMASGTFEVSPDAFGNGNYILEHDIPENDGFKTLPISYTNEDGYEIPGMQINNGQGSGIILPTGELQYAYEIDRDNVNEIPNNFEMMSPGKPYPYEVDRDNLQIQTNDGLTLDYEGDGARGNTWSTYSINDGDYPADHLNDVIYDEDISTLYNSQGPSNTHQKIYQGLNANEGGMNIEILDGSGDIDGASLGQKSSYASSMKSKSFSSGKGNLHNLNSDENGIAINIMDASNAADGTTHRFKSGSSSSSTIMKSSQKTSTVTNNNVIPIKITENVTDAEDNSAACDLPIDPEDDLMNF